MNKNPLPPFFVGQRVMCIDSHPKGHFKKGDEFVVRGILLSCCHWIVDIGVKSKFKSSRCQCGNKVPLGYYGAFRFIPLVGDYKTVCYTTVIDKELVSAN